LRRKVNVCFRAKLRIFFFPRHFAGVINWIASPISEILLGPVTLL
jgi:hypothetical protein